VAIENSKIIDAISINDSDEVVLTITDHLDWKDENMHLFLLQEKINTYLQFIESEEIYDSYPKARGRQKVIQVVSQFPITDSASNFITSAKSVINDAGFELRQKLFEEIQQH
jgi:hypothetical protein